MTPSNSATPVISAFVIVGVCLIIIGIIVLKIYLRIRRRRRRSSSSKTKPKEKPKKKKADPYDSTKRIPTDPSNETELATMPPEEPHDITSGEYETIPGQEIT